MTVRAEDLQPGQRIALSAAEVLSTLVLSDTVLVTVMHKGYDEVTVYHFRHDDELEVLA